MKSLLEFARTTLVGGVLVLLPIYLVALLLLKALAQVMALLEPVATRIPAAARFPEIMAILVVLAACFLAGWLVSTGPGGRAVRALQRRVLEKVPGYQLLRDVVARLGGDAANEAFTPALVEIEEALVPAYIVEVLPEDRCVVLVPSVPSPVSGALYILPADRVHRLDVPLAQVVKVYTRWGEGTGALLATLEARRAPGPSGPATA